VTDPPPGGRARGRSIFVKGLLLISVPVAFQLITAAVIITSHSAADRADALAARSGAIIDHTQSIARVTLQAHSAIRAMRVFRDNVMEREALVALDDLPHDIDRLSTLVVDPDQRGRLDRVAVAAAAYLAWTHDQGRLADAGQWDEFDAGLQ
jgi:hypothetical protein